MLKSFFSFLVVLFIPHCFFAQEKILYTKSTTAHVRIDNNYYADAWPVDSKDRPQLLQLDVKENPIRFAFITKENDSLVVQIEGGKEYAFQVVLNEKDTAYMLVKGIKYVPAVIFDQAYIQRHKNKTIAIIPPVYELVNILMALSETGKRDQWMIYKTTPYYKEMMAYFEAYKNSSAVHKIDSLLKDDRYHHAKMDAYAFEMDADGSITKSKNFDRINWSTVNYLDGLIADLEDFTKQSKFLAFYEEHQNFYTAQINAYQDSLAIQSMQDWLNTNFPTTKYDCFKIVFSPLVYGNQSANWFSDNGYTEAQAHVNFPYNTGQFTLSLPTEVATVFRGNIVFTELNHAFINPESEKAIYDTAIAAAFKDIYQWVEKNKPSANYSNAYAAFQEYMNWALVCVRYTDVVAKEWQEKLWANVEMMMVQQRGFIHFKEFNRFFIDRYKKRSKGATVADLYLSLIKWFRDFQKVK